jgi:hypothetical protein
VTRCRLTLVLVLFGLLASAGPVALCFTSPVHRKSAPPRLPHQDPTFDHAGVGGPVARAVNDLRVRLLLEDIWADGQTIPNLAYGLWDWLEYDLGGMGPRWLCSLAERIQDRTFRKYELAQSVQSKPTSRVKASR